MQGRKLTQHSLPSRKEPSQQSWILWRVCEKEWAGPLQHHRLVSSSTWQIFAYSRVSGKKIRRIDSTSQNTCYIMYFHWKVTSIKLRKGIWEGNILNCELSSQNSALSLYSKFWVSFACTVQFKGPWGLSLRDIRAIMKSRPCFYFSYKEHCEICQTYRYAQCKYTLHIQHKE